MKEICDVMTITELSRLTNKSRPTIYKWITLYSQNQREEIPQSITQLFDLICKTGSKKAIYDFCDEKFAVKDDDEELAEIFNLIRANREILDLKKLKEYIAEEINK